MRCLWCCQYVTLSLRLKQQSGILSHLKTLRKEHVLANRGLAGAYMGCEKYQFSVLKEASVWIGLGMQ